MTLGRLLFGGLALIFLLVLAGVETIHVRHTQRSLQLQLNAQANETATALALTLGSLLNTPDEVMAKTIITPVFDRGYYRSIRLLDMDGANLVGRARTPEANAVPNWFRQVFHVEEPVGQALVSSGWKQMGRVLVQPHPEFAYQQLWGTATATLAWLAGLFAMALFAATYFLKGILRPLEAVEAAAVAIGERRFLDVHVAAPTREVGRVVKAMNTLSGKLREAMQHEEARAARLLRDAYEDTTTGTLNERGFAQRVTALLAEEGRTGHGAMIMLSVARLEEVNRAEGLAAGDMLLAALGASLSKLCAPLGALAGHDRGASFLAFLPHCERDEAKAWVGRALELADTRTPCTAGIAWFEGAAQFEQLLDLARIAHTQARQRGESLRLLDMASGVAGSAEQWRARIESACVEGRIELHGQDAVALSDGRRLHVEITSRLIGGEGIDMPAALFVPMASRH
ncbi:MAG: LapD/MoxY N-terminal periplasmic domain-containing protein, partial [Burkholderiales bacterium]